MSDVGRGGAQRAEGERSRSISEAVTRADAFVARHAAPLERAYFETLLRRQDARALFAALAAQQGEGGALRPWRALPAADPALAATLRGLSWLDALGLLDHPLPERAVRWLRARQRPDGGWDEPHAGEARRIELTGEVAGLLAKTPHAPESSLRAAEGFLARHWAVERVQGPSYAPILAYVHALSHLRSELADAALQWCGRELERGHRTQAFAAVAVARVFLRARARALPGAALDASELVTALLAAQSDDGGWAAEPGAPRLDATLEAVEALLRLGPAAP